MAIDHTPHILLAEDEPIIATNFAMALEDAGYSVIGPVHTCDDALVTALHETIDCAVLDIELCGNDCIPALEALKGRGIPVLIATGLRLSDLDETLLRGTPVLMKPFRVEHLISEVSRLLAEASQPSRQASCYDSSAGGREDRA